MMKIAVLASGRGSNLQAIMDNIQNGTLPNVEIVLVASDKADCYSLVRASAAGIPTASLDIHDFSDRQAFDLAMVDIIRQSGAELVVLAGYMRLISADFLAAFPNRVINIHPALLPSFPGLHAQRQAWAYGVKVSGCTVHFVDSGMDSGPIIAQRVVPVLDNDTEDSLAARILEQEHIIYSEVIGKIAEGKVSLKEHKVYIEEG